MPNMPFFILALFSIGFAANPVLWTAGINPADFLNSANSTGANKLWDIGITGKGVSAAVVDAGFYTDHEIFNGKILNNYSGEVTVDAKSHGTHVAGIVVGMAPGAKLIVDNYRDADLDNAATFNNIVGLAQTYNIAAVNNSWGDPHPSAGYNGNFYTDPSDVANAYPLTAQAVQNLREVGVITVAASANDGGNNIMGYPNGLPGVLAVGALNQYGLITEFSNQYQKDGFFILAPGTEILSASEVKDGVSYYEYVIGTSQASPHVTGAIALLSSGARNATPDEIVNALYQSADRVNYNQKVSVDLVYVDFFETWGITMSSFASLQENGLITRPFDIDNATLDDWRYVNRLVHAIAGLCNTEQYSEVLSPSDIIDAIINDTGTAREDFKEIFAKLGGESELQYTDYGFLRVDNAYKYLTKLMSYSNGDTLIKGGAKTAGAMAKGFGNVLGNHLSEASSQAFQRLDELPFREQAKAYRKMSPNFYSSTAEYAQINTSETNARVASRKNIQSSLWGEGFGSYTDYAGTINASPYTAKSGVVLFGYNHKANNLQHGIFGSWSHSKIDGDDGYSRGSNLSIGGHFNYNASKFFVNGVLSYNLGSANVEREILIPGVKVKYAEGLAEYYGEYREDLLSDMYYNATAVSISRGGSTRIAGGYDLIQSDGWIFGTRAASSLSFLRSSGFNEFGAEEFSLSLNSFNSWYFDINAGLEVSKQVHQNFLAVVKATIARGKGFGDNLTGKFQESAGEFDVPVEHINQVSIVPEASLSWLVTDNLTINASYSGRFGGDYKRHSGNLGLSVGF
ncbi:hypothetical protein AGMMS49938_05640 [Fibrobacterales bacterium]|nr:hypothetical protein AGMMS49938_05640 [Fibrobacterales bacterium]